MEGESLNRGSRPERGDPEGMSWCSACEAAGESEDIPQTKVQVSE